MSGADQAEGGATTPSDPSAAPPPLAGYPGPPGYQPPPGYGPPPYGYPVAPPDLIGGEQTGQRARVALWAGLAGYIVQIGCSIIIFASFRDTFRTMLDDINAGRRTSTQTPVATDPATIMANLLSNLAGIVLLIVGVLFLIWFHKALTNARAVGLPLTHTPGWGVAGFLVPIINFWYPYQSMRDLFPADHPARPLVGRWWATWLGGSFAVVAVYIAAFFSPIVAGVLGLGVAGLYAVSAVTARELISAATEAHRQLAASGVPAPSGWPGMAPPAPYPAQGPGPAAGPGPAPGAPYPAPGAAYPPSSGWSPPPTAPPKDPWKRT